jgi:UDP-glucose 4-epimerase
MGTQIERAVIIGAGGFIGRALVTLLRQMGTAVLAVGRRPLPELACPSSVLDVTSRGALDGILDSHTTVFYLAPKSSVPDSVADPRSNFLDGMCGLFEVLESARKANSQVIFPSTGSVFDPSNKSPLSEKALVRPTSPYAASKVAGEAYCAAYHRSFGLNVKVARIFSVYGVGMSRFAIHDIIHRLQSNPSDLTILGDGTQIRDYLYIDDAVRGLVCIAVHGEPGEDYNLASGVPVNIMDLARKIAILMQRPDVPIRTSGESFPGDVPRWFADISKIGKIGFAPAISLEDGLTKTIRWFAEMNPRQPTVPS